MATFDSSAFDAVANFFGGSDSSDEKKNVDTDSIKDELNMMSRGGLKLGVGAEVKKEIKEVSTKDRFLKSVLQKKRRRNDEDDDTDDEISVSQTYDSDNSSEDEEKGRTSIAKTKVTIPTVLLTEPRSSTKKMKKKKKKLVKETSLETPSSPAQEKEEVGESSIASGKEVNEKIDAFENDEEKKVPKKFKRKKVRSKQKNIRKDTRRAIDKPSHLILGRSNYTGRPITKETRMRLNMPERVRYNGKKYSVQQSIDSIPGEGTLAIENFLKVEGDEAVKSTSNVVKKKMKKSKYKNLE